MMMKRKIDVGWVASGALTVHAESTFFIYSRRPGIC